MLSGEGAGGRHRDEPIDQRDSSANNNANLSGLEGVVGHPIDGEEDFSDDEMGIMGGHATNLDGLDKDQIMKMIDQEVDGIGYAEDGVEGVDLGGVHLELDDQIDDEIGDQEMFN